MDCHTGGERLSYPLLAENRLAGVALFARGSLFNHGDDPNVARWHVGDVCCFRTNRFVTAGEELTMAYCDSALLKDGDAARTALAHFDFVEKPAAAARPVLGVDEQRELMALPAGARLEAKRPSSAFKSGSKRLVNVEEQIGDPGAYDAYAATEIGNVAKKSATGFLPRSIRSKK